MKKRRVSPVVIVLVLIGLVVVAGVISFVINRYRPSKEQQDLNAYYNITADDGAAIIVNDQILPEPGIYKDDEVYISYENMEENLDTNFYYETATGEILLTTAQGTTRIKPDDTSVLTEKGAPAAITSKDGGIYLALSYIDDYADIKSAAFDNPPRAVIRTQWEGAKSVTVKSDTEVRIRGGIKSNILTSVKKGDSLIYIEDIVDWSKVMTEDGFIGYIKNDTLGSKSTLEYQKNENVYVFPNISKDYKINLAWHQVTALTQNDSFPEVVKEAHGLTTVSPTWYSVIDNNGTISSLADKGYVDRAHAMGLEVWGLIDNFNTEVSTKTFLESESKRGYIIEQLISSARDTGMDGINVDFEQLEKADIPNFLQFLRELTVKAHEQNLVISVDNPVWQNYNTYYRRAAQGRIVDYVVVMGYDEHYSGGEEAGSVASLPFVKAGFTETVNEVSSDKVIGGIPFYTRLWTENFSGGIPESTVYGMDGADGYVTEHGLTKEWDAELGQYFASHEDKNARYSIWLEEERSIEEKMKVIQELDLAGVASWKLGFERNTIWDVINKYLH